MKIVIAPDKFKGSLDAAGVAAAISRGIRTALPDATIDCCPIADGGEGTVAALVAATGGRLVMQRVTSPLPDRKVDATFGILGDGLTAVIEMAAASGLALLSLEDRNPLNTTTFGTGELLVAAARLGATHLLLGIGGSATTDGGIGCAQACGLPVILTDGAPVSATEPLCGRDLDSVFLIKHGRGEAIRGARITVACDVDNPLYGPDGAAPVFSPQKGATPGQVRLLDDSLRRLAERLGKTDLARTPGAGAAGGLGFGMLAFFGATLKPGVDLVIDALQLAERLKHADLCITGEGCLDSQTCRGKAPAGVARLCKQFGVPCIAFAGSIGADAASLREQGISAAFPIHDGSISLERSMREAAQLLEIAAARHVPAIATAMRPG